MNNKKGFVLMETLVVTLFTLFTFSLLYNNAVPLLGKYQELEYFNDLDTTYDLYHIKKFLRNDPSLATIKSSHYKVITCNNGSITNQASCYSLFDFIGIDTLEDEVIFLNPTYKNELKNDNAISSDVRDYLDYININKNIIILQNDNYVSYLEI